MKKFFAMVLHSLASLSKERPWQAESRGRARRKEGGRGPAPPRRAAKVSSAGLSAAVVSCDHRLQQVATAPAVSGCRLLFWGDS
ncbi:hypothetical protein ANANG_G00022540 [Anguilla anguilla]|uniref:Uncharacterized protein n=1 Tax=Anguilla anguilla TaxID=7936 RepID=A0A9D3N1P5_ANGAN|nr:hypothetical protein ANANG_G00022540 [Anguilla anguilla]